MKPKCFLYARKSTESEEKQVQSIEDQKNYWMRRADDMELDIIEVFSEEKSAKAPKKRTVFYEMLERMERENVRIILCWKLDRLTRNPVDSGTIQYMLQERKMDRIITSDREYHPVDAGLLMSVETGMANQFIMDLSKNTKRGMQGKVERGWMSGCAPIGYMNDKLEKTIIPDPDRYDLVKRIWDSMLTGSYTPAQMFRIANDQWGLRTRPTRNSPSKKVSRGTIYNLLQNEFYTGYIRYNSKLHLWNHTPMITREEFDRVQVLIGKKEKAHPSKHPFAYTGIIRCGECGCLITAEKKTKHLRRTNTDAIYTYYRCTHGKDFQGRCSQRKHIQEGDLEAQIDEVLASISLAPAFKDWAIGILKREHTKESTDNTAITKSLDTTLQSERKKLDRLTDLLLEEAIEKDDYQRRKDTLRSEITRLEKEREMIMNKRDDWIDLAEKTFNFATNAREHFQRGDRETKKSILMALGSHFLIREGKLTFDIHPWFLPVRKYLAESAIMITTFEPTKKGSVERTTKPSEDENLIWLQTLNEVRTAFVIYMLPPWIPCLA